MFETDADQIRGGGTATWVCNGSAARWHLVGVGGSPVAERERSTPDERFEAFYRASWHDAARWAAALCGDVARGEEIAQETFLRIAPRFAMLDHPDAYLRRALVNAAREAHRAAMRRAGRELRAALVSREPESVAGEVDPDVLKALDTLPATQRTVLVLRYWADWDEPDIADALGCRRATVRSHAKRGLDRLRTLLEDPR